MVERRPEFGIPSFRHRAGEGAGVGFERSDAGGF
jgi:hypothetical protein